MQKRTIGETAANGFKESYQFAFVQSAPRGQRNLETTKAKLAGPLDSLADDSQRQADHPDHRLSFCCFHFAPEHAKDLIELPVGNRVAFARRSEKINMRGQVVDQIAQRAAETSLVQTPVVPPRNAASSHNHRRTT